MFILNKLYFKNKNSKLIKITVLALIILLFLNNLHTINASEIRINSYTSYRQSFPSIIASAKQSYFYVVWQSEGQIDNFEIYIQKFDSNGKKIGNDSGADILVNTIYTGEQSSPRGGILSSGNLVICWQSTSTGNYDVFCNFLKPDLSNLYTDFQVNPSSTAFEGRPFVYVLANDTILVLWNSNRSGQFDVEAALYDQNKNLLKSRFIVNTTTTGNQGNGFWGISCAAFSNGRILVGYSSENIDGDSLGVVGKIYNSDFSVYKDEFRINTSSGSYQYILSLGITSTNKFIFAWTSLHTGDYNVYYKTFDEAGTMIKDETLINTDYTTGDQSYPSIAINSEDEIYISYRGNTSGASNSSSMDISCKIISMDPTVTMSSEFKFTRDGNYVKDYSSIAIIKNTLLVSTWQSYLQEGDEWNVFLNIFDLHKLVNTKVEKFQDFPSITALTNGGFVFSFSSSTGDSDSGSTSWGCLSQSYDANKNKVGSETHINTYTIGIQKNCKVLALLNGNLFYYWQSDAQDSSSFGIYGRILNAAGTQVVAEWNINEFTTDSQDTPYAVTNQSGVIFIIWQSINQKCSSCNLYGIYGKMISDSNTIIKPEFRISDSDSINEFNARACYSNGIFLVVWTITNSSNDDVYGKFFDIKGNSLNPTAILINKSTSGNQNSPDCAGLVDGNFVITYTSGIPSDILAKIIDSANIIIKDEFIVNTNTSDIQQNAKVQALSEGGFIVAWESNSADGSLLGVYYQRFLANGTLIALEYIANNYTLNDQKNIAIAQLKTGNNDVIIGFSSEGDTNFLGVYYEIVYNCPSGYYFDSNINFKCTTCNPIYGGVCDSLGNPVQCKAGLYRLEDKINCVSSCLNSDGYASNPVNGLCKKCSSNCLTCRETSDNCKSCYVGFSLAEAASNLFICINSFDGYYFDTTLNYYIKCDVSCTSCNLNKMNCIQCNISGKYYPKVDNVKSCILSTNPPSGYYFNAQTSKHEFCDNSCMTCISIKSCLTCTLNFYPIENNLNDCRNSSSISNDYFLDYDAKIYKKCDISCETCINKSVDCLKCKESFYKIKEEMASKNASACYASSVTIPNYIFDSASSLFIKCHESCLNCAVNKNYCIECSNANNYYKFDIQKYNYVPNSSELGDNTNYLTDQEIKSLNILCLKSSTILGFYLDLELSKEYLKCPDGCMQCTSSKCLVTENNTACKLLIKLHFVKKIF